MGTRRWTASLEIKWQPILTFPTRRAALLEWFESNVDVVAFRDDPQQDEFGVAVGSAATRLTIARDSLTVSLHAPESTFDSLGPAVDGAFEILAPSSPSFAHCQAVTSSELNGEYDSVRRRLAVRAAGEIEAEGFSPVDTAIMMDVATGEARGQIEFGVVTAPELRDRLSGRYRPRVQLVRTSVAGSSPAVDELPAVNLYSEGVWLDWHGQEVTDGAALVTVSRHLESESSRLANALAEGLG